MTIGLILRTAFLISGLARAATVAPQAEVSASSGPVKLILRLYKTKVRAGELLWEQIRLVNVGKQDLPVADRVFSDPMALGRQSDPRRRFGIFIEVRGADGKPLEPFMPIGERDIPPGADMPASGLLEARGPDEQKMVDGWKKQGLSSDEINRKLLSYNLRKQDSSELESRPPRPVLKPGEGIETKSWFHYTRTDKSEGRPQPKPIGDYSRLEFFPLERPGKYRIRAGLDNRPTKEMRSFYRKHHLSEYDHVLLRTPWVWIEVLP